MEEIDITKHPEYKQKNNRGRFNILPLIILGLIIYIIAYVDLRSFFESEQLNKNVAYIKGIITSTIDRYSTEFKSIDLRKDFLQAPTFEGANNTSDLNLNNFLQIPNPQLENLNYDQSNSIYPNNSTTQHNQRTQQQEGYNYDYSRANLR